MIDLNYTIKFRSFWHAGSGVATGMEKDSQVIRNADGLPFLPGRTLKGLLKDSAIILASLQADDAEKQEWE